MANKLVTYRFSKVLDMDPSLVPIPMVGDIVEIGSMFVPITRRYITPENVEGVKNPVVVHIFGEVEGTSHLEERLLKEGWKKE